MTVRISSSHVWKCCPPKAKATRCNFSTSFCGLFCSERRLFFYTDITAQFFPLIFADDLEEKFSLSRSIFRLNSIPPCRMWTQLYPILSVLLPTFAHIAAILHKQVVCSPQKHAGEKITAEYMDIAVFVSMRFASFAPQILAEKIATCSPSLILFYTREMDDSHSMFNPENTEDVWTVPNEDLSAGCESTVLYADKHCHELRQLFDWAVLFSEIYHIP